MTDTNGTAVARRDDDAPGTAIAKPRVFAFVESARARIDPFLPPGVKLERVAASFYLAVKDNPRLADCEPESLVRAIARIQQWGLEIGTTAHIAMFKGKATAIADYKGLIELMVAARAVRSVDPPRAVYSGDDFKLEMGTNPSIYHLPQTDPAKRGTLVGAYVVARLPGSRCMFEWMPLEDIEKIRKQSQSWGPEKVKECPPWYAKKTVVRQLAKVVPKNGRLAEVLARVVEEDEAEEIGEAQYSVMTPDPSWSDGDDDGPGGGALLAAAEAEEAREAAERVPPPRVCVNDDGGYGPDVPKGEPAPQPTRATPAQIARLVELVDVPEVDEERRATIIAAAQSGKLTQSKAGATIRKLEEEAAAREAVRQQDAAAEAGDEQALRERARDLTPGAIQDVIAPGAPKPDTRRRRGQEPQGISLGPSDEELFGPEAGTRAPRTTMDPEQRGAA